MKQGCSCTNTASRVKQGQTDGWSLEESDVWFIEALFLSNHVPAAFSNPHICSNASPKLGPRTAKLHSSFSVFYFLCYFPSSPNTHPSPPPPFALWLPWQQQHCTIHLLETWAPVPVERACLSHLYITCWVLMQSRRRTRSSLLSLLAGSSHFCFFFIFHFLFLFEWESQPWLHAAITGCHLCVPPLFPVTQWLLRSSFLLPFLLPPSFPPSLPPPFFLLLPSLPYLLGSVSLTAPVLSRQHQHWNLWRFHQKGKRSRERGKESQLLFSHSSALVFISGFGQFFPPPFFSIWWTGYCSRRKDCLCHWRGKEGSWCRTPAFRNASSGLKMVSPATPSLTCLIPVIMPVNVASSLSPAAPPLLHSCVCSLTSQLEQPCQSSCWTAFVKNSGKSFLSPELMSLLKGSVVSTMYLCIKLKPNVFFFFMVNWSVSCVSVGEHSIVFECVCLCVFHQLAWVANGACSCYCLSHFMYLLQHIFTMYCTYHTVLCMGWRAVVLPCYTVNISSSSSSSVLSFTWIMLSCAAIWFLLSVPLLQAPCLPALSHGCVNRTKCLNNTICYKIHTHTQSPHQLLLLLISGEWVLMRRHSRFSHHLVSPPGERLDEADMFVAIMDVSGSDTEHCVCFTGGYTTNHVAFDV